MIVQCVCPVCNVLYDADANRLKYGRQTTCSRQCSYKLRANKLKNNVMLTCAMCNTQFTRCVSKIKGGMSFCSDDCHYKAASAKILKRIVLKKYNITDAGRLGWAEGAKKTRQTRLMRNNYKHSESTKIAMSLRMANNIESGKISRSSKLENIVAGVLDNIGIAYRKQVVQRAENGTFAFVFDFMIGDNIAIEVNGTFWHADPRFYSSEKLHKIQIHNTQKWIKKINDAKIKGIKIIEIWEYDIEQDAHSAVMNALNAHLLI
jgi:G:T-mismatch repair DNA endonuclease (very short patch repair protein)